MTVTLGYTLLYVEDVPATMEFYQRAFGLEQRMLTPEGDYGELNTGTTTLSFVVNELANANLAHAGGFTPMSTEVAPPAISICFVTSDVQGVVEAALAAGARSYVDPAEKPWGQTVAYVRDPNGVLVEVASPIGG
jgi:uncharacterized glyoxalase superfamily protein PhnB